jgi:hypothetical protein
MTLTSETFEGNPPHHSSDHVVSPTLAHQGDFNSFYFQFLLPKNVGSSDHSIASGSHRVVNGMGLGGRTL